MHMFKLVRLLTPTLLCLLIAPLEAQEQSPLKDPKKDEPAVVKGAANEDFSVGTKSFDATTVQEMFDELGEQNAKAAAEIAPQFKADAIEDMDVITLAPVTTDPYHIRNFDQLLEKLDPQPRKRLQRLAELDPAAAADLQVSIRSEERFFGGENDAGFDSDAGRTANVDFRRVGSTISDAVKKAKDSMRKKQATDDQADLPDVE